MEAAEFTVPSSLAELAAVVKARTDVEALSPDEVDELVERASRRRPRAPLRALRRLTRAAAAGVSAALCENEPTCVTEQALVDDLFSLVRHGARRQLRLAQRAR